MRKSIGAQIRSVFNITDPSSKEFSDESDNDTLVDQSLNPTSMQNAQSCINYLEPLSTMTEASVYVNNESQTNSFHEITRNKELYRFHPDTVLNSKTCPSTSITASQERFKNLSSNKLDACANDDDIDAKVKLNLTVQPVSSNDDIKDCRKIIFENCFQKKIYSFDNLQDNDILALDTPEECKSQDLFSEDTQIIMETDVSVVSNTSEHDTYFIRSIL